MNTFLSETTSLLLLRLTISTRCSQLKTYKDANQFKIAHNMTQTGPRKNRQNNNK